MPSVKSFIPTAPGVARRTARPLPGHVSSVMRQRMAPAPGPRDPAARLPSNDGQVHPFDRVVNAHGLPQAGCGIC